MRRYFLFFVVSGFCGLVYEVVWLRLAMASFGVTAALVSIVLSMFMAGLGLGAWGIGALTRKVQRSNSALRLYAGAELLVGISSVLVPYQLKFGRHLLQKFGSFGAWQTSGYYLLVGAWLAFTFIPWCTCMGSTFPLLMAAIRQQSPSASERSFSYLYVANVLGAFGGTLASAFVLIELLGFTKTLYVSGALNLVLAVSAFALSLHLRPSFLVPARVSRQSPGKLYEMSRGSILAILFTTGFVSMGMEVVWVRQLTPFLGNVVYAFAGIIAVYLLATAIGSHDYRSWIRSHQFGDSASLWSFLAVFAVIPLVAVDPLVPLRVGGLELGGLRLASIVLFCAMAGFLTPLLLDASSRGDPQQAGTAYAVNLLGCILGPLAAGFCLLPRLGERRSVLVLALPLFAIAALIAFRHTSKTASKPFIFTPQGKFSAAAIAAIVIFSTSHDYEQKFAMRQVRRDYTATVIANGSGFDRGLLVNGTGMTYLTPLTKYMSHLPLAFLSRPPHDGLVICFGMGTSFRSMLSWGITTTAVDLVPSVPALFGYFHSDAKALVSSPRARIVVDDGRRFLDGSTDVYDVIVVDPPPPPSAPGSSLLYSREFYEVIKRHLREGGILQMWYPSDQGDFATAASVAKALREAFPCVRAFSSLKDYGIHFLASMQPLPHVSSSTLASRLPAEAAADLVEWGPESDPARQLDRILLRELPVDKIVALAPKTPSMRDDEPINEYYLLRSWFHFYR
jgi:spermidine synthase